MEKGNIIAKLNIKDYSKLLEEILANKPFSENAKNILLEILYKIEAGYNDYKTVKVNVLPKKDIIEEIIDLISKCNKIEIVKPKVADEDLKKCKISKELKGIIAYPNETSIVYSLFMISDNKYIVPEEYEIISPAVSEVLNMGRAINMSEIVRDFDGWSWNINQENIEDIFKNFLYQSLNLVVNLEEITTNDAILEIITKMKEFSNKQNINRFLNRLYQLAVIEKVLNDTSEKQRLINIKTEQEKSLEILLDKPKFLEDLKSKKITIEKELANIELIFSDDMLLKKEYIEQNKVLPKEKRVFSLSDFSELQEQRKEFLQEKLEKNNKRLEPQNYLKEKTALENNIRFLNDINLEDATQNKEKITNRFIETTLKMFEDKIKIAETKKNITDIIYKIRYYKNILIKKDTKIKDIKEVSKTISEVDKEAITVACNLKTINIISQDILDNYRIISEILDIGIINLESIWLKPVKKDKSICFEIYEDKSLEKTICFENIVDLNVKPNRKIKLFI